ncbi:hypothetical protein V7128_26425 [Neobacillus vireti]|uniref:hypothetical protein n=1 Tax=Neobacillus vireti TaxID=220686 RepID=UPI002FFFDE8C
MKEPEYAEVKAKFFEFVETFLSKEEGTVRSMLLPGYWLVSNEKLNFYASIRCESKLQDWNETWYAVVSHEGSKSNYPLIFD